MGISGGNVLGKKGTGWVFGYFLYYFKYIDLGRFGLTFGLNGEFGLPGYKGWCWAG